MGHEIFAVQENLIKLEQNLYDIYGNIKVVADALTYRIDSGESTNMCDCITLLRDTEQKLKEIVKVF